MKRRTFIHALSLPTAAFMVGCKKYESWDTIVKGRVIDESNQPVEGIIFRLEGINKTGILKDEITFSITAITDKDGYYQFSYLIPSSTDMAELGWVDTSAVKFDKTHYFYIERNGTYIMPGAPPSVWPENFGKTSTFNFQIRKI